MADPVADDVPVRLDGGVLLASVPDVPLPTALDVLGAWVERAARMVASFNGGAMPVPRTQQGAVRVTLFDAATQTPLSERLVYHGAGADLKIGFNARYVMDAINALTSDPISMEFNDELSPGLVRGAEDAQRSVLVDVVAVLPPPSALAARTKCCIVRANGRTASGGSSKKPNVTSGPTAITPTEIASPMTR